MFFFYILYRASTVNTLHDKITTLAHDKYWEVCKQFNHSSMLSTTSSYSSTKDDMMLLYLCDIYTRVESETYAIFKLGSIVVKKGRVTVTMIGFILYCLYLLVTVKGKV